MSESRTLAQPPHTVEAEEAVIGSLLLAPKMLSTVIGFLEPEDFYIVRHQWIYEAILKLHREGKPIDFTMLISALELGGHLAEIGGAAYVLNLVNNTPTALHVRGYADLVTESAMRRKLIEAASRIVRDAHDTGKELQTISRDAFRALDEATSGHTGLRVLSMEQVNEAALEMTTDIEEKRESDRFVTTGLPDVDALMDYTLWRGMLLGVFGVEKVGKTRFVSEIAFKCGRPVLYYCGETQPEIILFRQAQAEAGVSRGMIRDDALIAWQNQDSVRARSEFGDALAKLEKTPIQWVWGSASIPLLRERVRAFGAQVVIIDSIRRLDEIQLAENQVQAYKPAWAACEALAKDLDVLVVVVSEQTKELYGQRATGKGLYGVLPYEVDHLLYLYDEHAGKIGLDAPPTRDISVTLTSSRHADTSGEAVYKFNRPFMRIWCEE